MQLLLIFRYAYFQISWRFESEWLSKKKTLAYIVSLLLCNLKQFSVFW